MSISYPKLALLGSFLACSSAIGEEAPKESDCPMVSTAMKTGMFVLVETLDSAGKKGIGKPGENIRLQCTLINLTKRSIFVAEDYITPSYGSVEVVTEHPESFPEPARPLIEHMDGMIYSSSSIGFPRKENDWGHIRRWISIAPSHDFACGCCVRNRQFTKSLQISLPKSDWSEVRISASQVLPSVLLSPQQSITYKSNLDIVIKRDRSEQAGAGQPATRPVDEPEGGDKPQPEAEGRSR